MNAKKTGLVLFWIGALYMVGMAFGAGWWIGPALRNLSPAQYGETIWTFNGALFLSWALSVPLGSILVGIGILLYAQVKGIRIWLFGAGVFLILLIVERLLPSGHFPPLYGIGGGFILAFFLAILWFWAKKRAMLGGPAKTAADLQLASYVFFLVTAWYLCKAHGTPYMKALEGEPLESPVSIIVYLVLGWLFLFLSHYKSTHAA